MHIYLHTELEECLIVGQEENVKSSTTEGTESTEKERQKG
jgi:hypothetical protein